MGKIEDIQERNNTIIGDKISAFDAIYEKFTAFKHELNNYIDNSDDEYTKQVAMYNDMKHIIGECLGIEISLRNFKSSLQYALHEDGNDKIEDLHKQIENQYPAMNLTSEPETDATYEAIYGKDRTQWPI